MADGERKVTQLERLLELPKAYVNVAIYCRVSTSNALQQQSLENQIDYYRNMLKKHSNWKLVDIYADVHSGKEMSGREEFIRMMYDCLEGKTDLIITKSISRFGRNTVEILENIYKLRYHNVDAFFEIENMFISDTGNDFLLSVLGALAQADSTSRSQNIKMGIQYQLKSGTSKLYSRPCYGYVNDKDGNMIINEEQADNVKLIFQLYIDGHSILSIIRELSKREIKSPTGKEKWSKRTIETLLSNEKYNGYVLVGKTYGSEFPNNKRYINKGEREQYLANYAHEAIILLDVFEGVQEEKVRRSNVNRNGETATRKDTHYSMKSKSITTE